MGVTLKLDHRTDHGQKSVGFTSSDDRHSILLPRAAKTWLISAHNQFLINLRVEHPLRRRNCCLRSVFYGRRHWLQSMGGAYISYKFRRRLNEHPKSFQDYWLRYPYLHCKVYQCAQISTTKKHANWNLYDFWAGFSP